MALAPGLERFARCRACQHRARQGVEEHRGRRGGARGDVGRRAAARAQVPGHHLPRPRARAPVVDRLYIKRGLPSLPVDSTVAIKKQADSRRVCMRDNAPAPCVTMLLLLRLALLPGSAAQPSFFEALCEWLYSQTDHRARRFAIFLLSPSAGSVWAPNSLRTQFRRCSGSAAHRRIAW
jgi:hypothetical protein